MSADRREANMHDPGHQERSSLSSASSLSEAFMICQEAGQEAEEQRRFQPSGLHPLIIPQDPTSVEQNPFSADPRTEQPSSGGSQDMVDVDGVPSGPFHQLHLTSRSIDESCESGFTSRSPTFSTLSRSQSELRASPLRNYYANACRGRFSEGFSSGVGLVSPRPTSPCTSTLSTPPLSARMHSAPVHADFGVPTRRAKTMPRLSMDACSDRSATATRALSQRLQSKLERAQGEPLTPYLM